ncbi:TniB family NTP-binding protein [Streptomyces violaceusniger]|uniref:AAA+ ATPase domain-containing protein n=1 Tax=Streptomyces violaceusniger TaxID=68280 RepID=A0A4D4LMD4_STRVO|nr:hypothetical protein SVIO_110990 [Streptomyces violaceusniger]
MVNPRPQSTAPASTTADRGGGTAEPSWPLTTWQGWNRFAATDPPTPPRPGDPPRSTEERLACHSAFVTIRTPAISTLATQVRTLTILGRHQQTTARPSLIVTGPAAAGKTTALLHVSRACHLAHTRKNPPPPGSAHAAVPVAYALVPPGATAKTLITEFARYLGIPTTTRMTQTQITDAVCHTYTAAGIHLVLIDEIHRLNPRTTTGAQAAGLLKDLTERLPATFVYAGINLPDTPCSPAPAASKNRQVDEVQAVFDRSGDWPRASRRAVPHCRPLRGVGRLKCSPRREGIDRGP